MPAACLLSTAYCPTAYCLPHIPSANETGEARLTSRYYQGNRRAPQDRHVHHKARREPPSEPFPLEKVSAQRRMRGYPRKAEGTLQGLRSMLQQTYKAGSVRPERRFRPGAEESQPGLGSTGQLEARMLLSHAAHRVQVPVQARPSVTAKAHPSVVAKAYPSAAPTARPVLTPLAPRRPMKSTLNMRRSRSILRTSSSSTFSRSTAIPAGRPASRPT